MLTTNVVLLIFFNFLPIHNLLMKQK
jgi:hypothetical protein